MGLKSRGGVFSGLIPALFLVFIAQSARAQWENVRRVGASSYLIENSTGGYLISHTIGEPSASLLQLAGSEPSVLSGYLSQIPSNSLFFNVLNFESTGAVVSEGALLVPGDGNSIKFAFPNDVSVEAVVGGVEVREVLNHLAEPVNSTQAVSVALIANERAVSLNSAANWKRGSLYAVRYSSGFADTNGIALSRETTYYFTVKMDYLKDNAAAALSDFKTKVAIPAGAYSSDFFVIVSTAQTSQEVEAANRKISSMPRAYASALGVLSASVLYEAGGNSVQPSSSVVISFPYSDDNNDGIVDSSFPPVRAKDLAVWRLDENNRLWVKQVGASVDGLARQVSLQVAHFSSYALMGVPDTDVSTVYPYPVPFKPNAGNPARYGDWTRLITFTGLPSYGKLRIYTLTGDLIRELEVVPPEMKWDVRNSAGEMAASGVYIWEVVSGKNRKTGKLMVVK